MELSVYDINLFKKVEAITGVDYEITGNKIEPEKLLYAIDDLVGEIDILKDKLEELEEDIQENYRPLTKRELAWDIRDFY